ncbi:tetratricopeptide repeat protein [Sorangium sp. So ce1128]
MATERPFGGAQDERRRRGAGRGRRNVGLEGPALSRARSRSCGAPVCFALAILLALAAPGCISMQAAQLIGQALGQVIAQAVIESPTPPPLRQEPPPHVPEETRRRNAEALALQKRRELDANIGWERGDLASLEWDLGRWHPRVAASLNRLAALYIAKGDHARAQPLLERALAIVRRELGPWHLDMVGPLNNLAGVHRAKGDYARAPALVEQALAIREKALGKNHADVAESLNDLAELYVKKGNYVPAEQLLGRALAIREKALGEDHPDVAESLNNLAMLHYAKGHYAPVEPLFYRALEIREKALGPYHPSVAESLNNLALLHHAQRHYVTAEMLYKRALEIRDSVLHPDHPDVAESLDNLAMLHYTRGDDTPTEPLFNRALAIREKALGKEHPDVAESLGHLALLYRARGDYAQAAPLFDRALAISEKALGKEHPDVATLLQNIAILHQAQGDGPEATRRMTLATAIEERNAAVLLATGADEQKRAYIATLRRSTEAAVSLHVRFAPDDEAAKRLAITTIVRRKGRVLDAMAYGLAALRRHVSPENRALLDRLSRVSAELSAATWRGPEAPRPDEITPDPARLDAYRARLAELEESHRQLEAEVSRRSPEVRAQLSPIPLAGVQAAVPAGAALVELFRYHPLDPAADSFESQWGKPRYVAYVLRREGDIAWADLGEAEPIEEAVHGLRKALARAAVDPRPPARALDALVMQPIRGLLGPTQQVVLSPDGALNLVPFGALVDEDGRYLIERYAFTYLPSGRDLVRFRATAPPRQSEVVFAAPDYDGPPAQSPPEGAGAPSPATDVAMRSAPTAAAPALDARQSRGGRGEAMRFSPLASAAEEGRAVGQQLVRAQVLLGADATESAVKALHGPRLLHIVTHGFFLPDQRELHSPPRPPSLDLGTRGLGVPGSALHHIEDPLLRSGLALAGANRRSTGEDDGILTALEASQLDLNGTQLVVLAACETGVGDTRSGDGVYGLRRALVIAGAETQVMSLWKVSDDATRELMLAYYDLLLAGGGRGEALRDAQLAMLANPERAHPFYWASFIVSGNDAALADLPIVPSVPRVPPHHGCGCDLAAQSPEGANAGAAAALLAACALAFRRRDSGPRERGAALSSARPRSWRATVSLGLAVLLTASGCTTTQAILLSSSLLGGLLGAAGAVQQMNRQARLNPPAIVPEEARRLDVEVLALFKRGNINAAIPLAQRELAILEDALGRWSSHVGICLHTLALLYRAKGDDARAEPLLDRASVILELELGKWHPAVAAPLSSLASLHKDKGDYARAMRLAERALAIREKALGKDHPDVATSLNSIAELYVKKGERATAEPLFSRALAIREKALGKDHPDVAASLDDLAMLHHAIGDDATAAPLLSRALAIREKALGKDHPNVATSLNNLATLHHAIGDDATAEPLLSRALAIREKALGRDHPDVAASLDNLAVLHRARGDYARATPLFDRALAIREKALGKDHPDVATSLNNLAVLHRAMGDYARAAPLFDRALAIREKALGKDHPDVATLLQNIAILHQAQGDAAEAARKMTLAAAIEDRNAAALLSTGADEQKRAYMAALRRSTEAAVSLHVHAAPDDEAAKRLAITTIVRRKGRALDAMAYGLAALRRRVSPEDRALLDKLSRVSAELSAATWRGPEEPRSGEAPPDPARLDAHRARLARLEQSRRQLEAEVSRRSPEVRAQLSPLPLAEVQAAVPAGAALVELFRYHPLNPQAESIETQWGKPRYVAYVLRREGDIAWADLGEAEPIEEAVDGLRKALARAASDPEPPARALDALVMQPIRHLLGPTQRVLLSPDGALNLVPFGALVDEHGYYLIERYAFTYLPSGRDLVRLRATAPARQGAVVIAAPDYDVPLAPPHTMDAMDVGDMHFEMEGLYGGASAESDPARRANGAMRFHPLAAAAEEGRAVGQQLAGAQVLLGTAATKAAVKALHGPRLLHIVTHGFFLPDQSELRAPPPPPAVDFGSRGFGFPGSALPYIEDPLLRSGLAFTGANLRSTGDDDGILTALEASQLDLSGTQLVVLAACETGVGDARSGDGVYGLRRALVMAGAETQVMSLWKVNDDATRELMLAYYDRLLAGGGRGGALRDAQLAMLATQERAHPFYWASFIVSGNDAALDGGRVEPGFGQVHPGARGCSCEVGAQPPQGIAGASAALLAAAALLTRRRRSTARSGGRSGRSLRQAPGRETGARQPGRPEGAC